MKAAEMVKKLQEVMAEHGDLEIFSRTDYAYVQFVSVEHDILTDKALIVLDEWER